MNTFLIALCIAGQINAGKTPEEYSTLLRIDRYAIHRGTGKSGATAFPISRYLRLAEYLQSLPEPERVLWLRMAARSPSLDEPAVFVARILITGKPGLRLRPIAAGIGQHAAGKSGKDFPDSPIEIYRGVPFCVADSASIRGISEDATSYVEYLLQNGEWRTIRFKPLSNTAITEIAWDYLHSLETDGRRVRDSFLRDILAQAAVPMRPSETKGAVAR